MSQLISVRNLVLTQNPRHAHLFGEGYDPYNIEHYSTPEEKRSILALRMSMIARMRNGEIPNIQPIIVGPHNAVLDGRTRVLVMLEILKLKEFENHNGELLCIEQDISNEDQIAVNVIRVEHHYLAVAASVAQKAKTFTKDNNAVKLKKLMVSFNKDANWVKGMLLLDKLSEDAKRYLRNYNVTEKTALTLVLSKEIHIVEEIISRARIADTTLNMRSITKGYGEFSHLVPMSSLSELEATMVDQKDIVEVESDGSMFDKYISKEKLKEIRENATMKAIREYEEKSGRKVKLNETDTYDMIRTDAEDPFGQAYLCHGNKIQFYRPKETKAEQVIKKAEKKEQEISNKMMSDKMKKAIMSNLVMTKVAEEFIIKKMDFYLKDFNHMETKRPLDKMVALLYYYLDKEAVEQHLNELGDSLENYTGEEEVSNDTIMVKAQFQTYVDYGWAKPHVVGKDLAIWPLGETDHSFMTNEITELVADRLPYLSDFFEKADATEKGAMKKAIRKMCKYTMVAFDNDDIFASMKRVSAIIKKHFFVNNWTEQERQTISAAWVQYKDCKKNMKLKDKNDAVIVKAIGETGLAVFNAMKEDNTDVFTAIEKVFGMTNIFQR